MAFSTEAVASSDSSAVSWASVFAGAAGATALSLVLFLLGTGIGLSVISPWANDGASAEALGVSTIIWITIVQALASVLGGYLAGRLRTRWVSVHTDEVFFRDTAHGFLTWAVSTLLMATLLSSAVASTLAMGAKAGGAAVAATATAATAATAGAASAMDSPDGQPVGYFADVLMRATQSGATQGTAAATPSASPASAPSGINSAEIARVFTHALGTGQLTAEDSQYLGQAVASKTGMSPAEAEKRVTDTFTQFKGSVDEAAAKAKAAADEARKASAYAALWLVVSLLLGAFLASYAATFGGRLRDSTKN